MLHTAAGPTSVPPNLLPLQQANEIKVDEYDCFGIKLSKAAVFVLYLH